MRGLRFAAAGSAKPAVIALPLLNVLNLSSLGLLKVMAVVNPGTRKNFAEACYERSRSGLLGRIK